MFTRLHLVLLLIPLLAPVAPATAADTRASSYFDFKTALEPKEIDRLRYVLRCTEEDCPPEFDGPCAEIGEPCKPANEALQKLFEGTFRQTLPDVLVYIERQEDGSLRTYHPVLLWKGRNTPYVFGARHLFVLVVSDKKLALDAKFTTVTEKTTNPLAGILTLLKFTTAEPKGKEPKSDTAHMSWTPLGKRHDDPFVGWARLDMEVDSVNRLTLVGRSEAVTRTVTIEDGADSVKLERKVEGPEPLPPRKGDTIPFRDLTAHVSNSRSTHAGFGVALGATLDVGDTALGEDSGDVHQNAYALAKLYVLRPRLKVGPRKRSLYRPSIGVVVGTDISTEPFKELVGGIAVGHVIGKLGIMVGVNLVKPQSAPDDMSDGADPDRRRNRKLFLGVEYSF